VTFDLVVATVDRAEELGRLLTSLESQTHTDFRVLLVDQNEDDRLAEVVAAHHALPIQRLRSEKGLSRARNVALREIRADLVAFPDDDCVYAPDLLERVARRFATEPELDGLTGRALDGGGRSSASWAVEPARLTRDNLWNRAISFTIFLRGSLVGSIGEFDEELGLGSGTASASGEETEYLVRAVTHGARIEYDPALTVTHDKNPVTASVGARDGASLGYILHKHDYPRRTVARMLLRPAGGAALALARRDRVRARFHFDTLLGRVRGYRS
jgi:glycosyltransferase involved in cell wall biosynthesis